VTDELDGPADDEEAEAESQPLQTLPPPTWCASQVSMPTAA